MRNRAFFPQQALDVWLGVGQVDVTERELVIKAEDRKYRIVDAIRVLREVTTGDDPHEIVGRVKTVNFLTELGAELLGTSMLIGDNAYDVVPGFLGSPVGTLDEGQSDEELLAQYLQSSLE